MPPGGPRGPRGPRGMGPRFNRPFPHFNYNIPEMPRTPGTPVGTTMVETFTDMEINTKEKFKRTIKRHGVISGTIKGFRTILSGGLRHQVYLGRLETIDMQLSEKRLTKAQALKRKMDAAKKYNRYLLKIGYLTREEYTTELENFAKSIGVNYIDDTQTRTR